MTVPLGPTVGVTAEPLTVPLTSEALPARLNRVNGLELAIRFTVAVPDVEPREAVMTPV
jgi:hypothetical protein